MTGTTGGLAVVLAGGGGKTLWGMGVLDSIRDLLPPVEHWAGVSAGAAMGLIQVSERIAVSLDYVVAAARANPRNFYPGRALRGGPVFPHERLFRDSLGFVLAEGGFERVIAGAPVHILLSYVVAGRSGLRAGLEAFGAFTRRDRIGRLHGPSSPPPGMGVQVVRSTDASGPEQLIDWVLMSANTPVISRTVRIGGRRYIDGALVDNVPVRALPDHAKSGRVLVLLSSPKKVARRPLRTAEGGTILYLAPTEDTPARTWDYASGDALQATIDAGRRDGEILRKRVAELFEV
ncbi:patatin-like phospholipase family protein [Nannocystaceae bacterium ST9]